MFASFPNLNYKELYARIYGRHLLSCRSRLKARWIRKHSIKQKLFSITSS